MRKEGEIIFRRPFKPQLSSVRKLILRKSRNLHHTFSKTNFQWNRMEVKLSRAAKLLKIKLAKCDYTIWSDDFQQLCCIWWWSSRSHYSTSQRYFVWATTSYRFSETLTTAVCSFRGNWTACSQFRLQGFHVIDNYKIKTAGLFVTELFDREPHTKKVLWKW